MQSNVPITAETLQAMRTLLQAGVSDEALGRAMRDLLLRGLPARPASPPAPTYVPGSEALTSNDDRLSIDAFHQTTASTASGLPAANDVLPTGNVVMKVRLGNGKPTNMTIPAALLRRVAIKLGSDDAARQRVRDLAREAPESADNKSGWVQSALNEQLAKP